MKTLVLSDQSYYQKTINQTLKVSWHGIMGSAWLHLWQILAKIIKPNPKSYEA